MSAGQIGRDKDGAVVQAFPVPLTGQTTKLTLALAGTSYVTAALPAGIYRLVADQLMQIAQGAVAVATDMQLRANVEEYFYIPQGAQIAAISAVAGASLQLTKV